MHKMSGGEQAMSKPEVRKFLCISTVHLTDEQRAYGTREAPPDNPSRGWGSTAWRDGDEDGFGGVMPYAYGFWLWVPDTPALEEEDKGVPANILAIGVLARKHGCDYVQIDSSGPVVEGLEVFE